MEPSECIRACASLLERALLRPSDEPRPDNDPAREVALLAQRCLASYPTMDRELRAYLLINRANGLRLCSPSDDAIAQQAFSEALGLMPEQGAWWFDWGVCHKWRGRFEEARTCTTRARDLLGDEKRILWNLAIAATALEEGEEAVALWRMLGIEAEQKLAPNGAIRAFVEGLPAATVRVAGRRPTHGAPDGLGSDAIRFEMVSVAPLSPCHGVVQSATYLDGPVDYGDIVLWDGAPVGVDSVGTPCFSLLARLAEGEEQSFRFLVSARDDGWIRALESRLGDGVRIFPHRERRQRTCPRCRQENVPEVHPCVPNHNDDAISFHTNEEPHANSCLYGTLVLSPDANPEEVVATLEQLVREEERLAIAIPELHESLHHTKRAGQHHKQWASIERRETADSRR